MDETIRKCFEDLDYGISTILNCDISNERMVEAVSILKGYVLGDEAARQDNVEASNSAKAKPEAGAQPCGENNNEREEICPFCAGTGNENHWFGAGKEKPCNHCGGEG